MATMAIYSQPSLSLQSYGDTDDGSSSSGELLRGIATSSAKATARRRSCGDVRAAGAGGGVPCGKPRHEDGGGDDEKADTFLPRYGEGYVSFEDLIGTATFWDGGSGRPHEAGISHPLVRTASRLYACEAVKPPRRRQASPGPLGTRRGSAMHGLVKKYVHPFFGFVAGIFCCGIPS
ncbi:hypothetical protein BAE44_0026189 [Dichanthelium oligosanthes]|uniref:Uncharacterized protein n=1 Tax=Dichanthelium oligosanthes TaxID=888268 RepID=A0A1E5UIU7_9POAL|nr:hypothetical protein BAE44_0026189 [Dichanthelium oligosanthes]